MFYAECGVEGFAATHEHQDAMSDLTIFQTVALASLWLHLENAERAVLATVIHIILAPAARKVRHNLD